MGECNQEQDALIKELQAENAALRAEVATPVLVATNRLAESLADARAEIAKLRAEALRGAAERAWQYIKGTGDYWSWTEEELRAAILADEPNEERGAESNPYKGTYNAVCFKRHDSDLSFGVCERDDGFEFVVCGDNGTSSYYALHTNSVIERLDEPKEERVAEPQVGDVVAWLNSRNEWTVGRYGMDITRLNAVLIMRRAEVERRIEGDGVCIII